MQEIPSASVADVRRVRPRVPWDDDSALVAAARVHATDAAARIWGRHAPYVRHVLRRMLGPSTELDDALQDVFLRLFRDLGSLREPRALRGFLQRITIHVAVSELRRRRARGWLLLSDDGTLPDPSPPSDDLAPPLRHLAISDVLDRMTPESRLVFVLRHIEGRELTELASALGCSLATTKRRVAASERRVRQLAATGGSWTSDHESRSIPWRHLSLSR